MIFGTPLRFNELHTAPSETGLYAWYYALELTEFDVKACQDLLRETDEPNERKEILRVFLEQRVFKVFSETPYEVDIKGALKPRYKGTLKHQTEISDSLLTRLSRDPTRLSSLRKVLAQSVPFFASPIYIGMAKNLRSRLLQHKKLIEKFESVSTYGFNEDDVSDEARADHNFALEVTRLRRLRVTQLRVYLLPCPYDTEIKTDLENLLNRINHPLCGRN